MRSFFVGLLIALTLAANLQAATFQFKDAKVEISSPDTWKSAQEGDEVTFTAPDGEMAVVFLLLPAGLEGKASEYLDKELDKAIGKVTWGEKPAEETINDMKFEIWEGKAKDGAMAVDAVYIDTPADRTLAGFWFSTADAEKKYEADVLTIIKGIKPLK